MTADERRDFGRTAAEARRLVGATITDVEVEGNRVRWTLALLDGATVIGYVSPPEQEVAYFARIPILTDATVTEPDDRMTQD